ncbi:hypothetical protein Q1695_007045 [Nippostrongylus brasiliensis]|nr:hypothetical protein Q1695_007045 [Nippostrongylus brasiliensis]
MFVYPSQYDRDPSTGGANGVTLITPTEATPSFPFWIRFSLSAIGHVLCLGFNVFFCVVSIVGRHEILNNPFYAIVSIFSLAAVINNTCQLIYIFTVGLGGVSSSVAGYVSILTELVFTYFTILLMFFMALNRYASYSTSHLMTFLIKRKGVCHITVGLLLLSVTVSIAVCKLSGLRREFDDDMMDDFATNVVPIAISNCVFYTLPVIASVLYFVTYRSLRSQESGAVTDKTKTLLDKAEKVNMKAGINTLVVYLISLIVNVVMIATKPLGLSILLLFIAQLLCSTAPQLCLPITNPFYTIVNIFSLAAVVNNTCQLIYTFTVGLGDVSSSVAGCVSMLIELVFTYFSILLLFFMALNRYAAHSTSHLTTFLINRKGVCYITFGLLLLSVIVSIAVYKLSGLRRGFKADMMSDFATNMIANCTFYALPVIASVFYFVTYRSLRSQELSAITDTTKTLLDKAERVNMKAGINMLVVYLISFIMNVVMIATKPFSISVLLLFIAQLLCSAAPQLCLPITNPFYTIANIFSLAVVVNNTCQLIYIFTVELGGVTSSVAGCVSMLFELVFTYFSILLLFFMALNRYAAHSTSHLTTFLINRKGMCYITFGLLLLSVIVSIAVYQLSGLRRGFDDMMDDSATNVVPIAIANCIFYSLPIIASVFYFVTYRSLRSQEPGAVTDTTKTLLDNAEKVNLKAGISTLIVYLISLIMNVVMIATKPFGISVLLLFIAQLLCSTAPQLCLPITVMIFSKEVRHAAKHTCFYSLKEQFHANNCWAASVGAASSSNSLPTMLPTNSITTQSRNDVVSRDV